ncbi:MAG: CoA pyrophosphatase [Desulfomonile tiedjei]|nr:CoA pyrophosphatase [Desulfomonile tiedjei]
MNNDKSSSRDVPCFEKIIRGVLASRDKKALPVEGMTVAAVLMPLFLKNGAPHVLLTKRSDLVEHHKGEISFPGGKLDPTDPDLLHCALREAAEEVGIKPDDVRVIGELDDFYTVATHFLVVPFVGIIPYPYEFKPSEREIADLLGVPLEVFFDPDRMTEAIWMLKGQPISVISYRWQGHNIWGATARIMKHFTEVLEEMPNCGVDNGKNPGASFENT